MRRDLSPSFNLNRRHLVIGALGAAALPMATRAVARAIDMPATEEDVTFMRLAIAESGERRLSLRRGDHPRRQGASQRPQSHHARARPHRPWRDGRHPPFPRRIRARGTLLEVGALIERDGRLDCELLADARRHRHELSMKASRASHARLTLGSRATHKGPVQPKSIT